MRNKAGLLATFLFDIPASFAAPFIALKKTHSLFCTQHLGNSTILSKVKEGSGPPESTPARSQVGKNRFPKTKREQNKNTTSQHHNIPSINAHGALNLQLHVSFTNCFQESPATSLAPSDDSVPRRGEPATKVVVTKRQAAQRFYRGKSYLGQSIWSNVNKSLVYENSIILVSA